MIFNSILRMFVLERRRLLTSSRLSDAGRQRRRLRMVYATCRYVLSMLINKTVTVTYFIGVIYENYG